MAEFKLVPCDIPPVSRATVYEKAMDAFLDGSDKQVKVEIPKKKPSTIHQGLLKQKRVKGAKYASVNVVRRGLDVYLAR